MSVWSAEFQKMLDEIKRSKEHPRKPPEKSGGGHS